MNEFPHTAIFRKSTKLTDGGGGYTYEWSDAFTSEAFVCPISGSEYVQAQQLTNPVDYSVFVPYREDITPDMRIFSDGKLLDVQSAPLDQGGQKEVILLKCKML